MFSGACRVYDWVWAMDSGEGFLDALHSLVCIHDRRLDRLLVVLNNFLASGCLASDYRSLCRSFIACVKLIRDCRSHVLCFRQGLARARELVREGKAGANYQGIRRVHKAIGMPNDNNE